MVGDRRHDVQAASRHNVPTVGVLWGHGGREELESAGAAVIIDRPRDLATCALEPMTPSPRAHTTAALPPHDARAMKAPFRA
jgi:HAD-hyrolase-like